MSLQHELRPGLGLNVGYYRTWYGGFTVTENLAVTAADYDTFCITAPVDSRLPNSGERVCGLYDIKPAAFGLVENHGDPGVALSGSKPRCTTASTRP